MGVSKGNMQQKKKQRRRLLTVALESVFVSVTINAKEVQEIVTIGIPRAFLHANNNDYVVMKMNGLLLVELMVKTDPKNQKNT